jgi:hypothetical protein
MVKSQRRAQPMSFGSLEVVRAFRYPGPERQVIVLWTSCNWIPDPASDAVTRVTLETDVEKVEWWDCFGNPIPVQVTQGKIGLDVGSYPSYLVVPSQAKVNPMVERWGPNLALAALGATAESTSEMGTLPAVSAIDGNMASGSCWRSLTPNDLPQSITVTLAGPAPIDRVGLWSYSARGYDIETMGADGQWQKLVSKRDQPHRRFRNEPFPAVTTDQIRLTVVDSSSDRAEVAELQVFSSGATAGKATELVNWALKTNGATAKASSEMTKDVTVAVQDWGAKQPRISQVKLEARAENAIDGKRLVGHWREFFPTTWMAAPGAALPQWLEVDLAKPRTITSIAVFTIAFANWTPADSGIRDWDVQVWDGKDWKTVDAVTANTRVSKISRLKPPVTTDRVRVLVKATNDPEGTVGLMEVQAYGPAE